MSLDALPDAVDLALGLAAVAGMVLGWWRWARPRLKARAERNASIDIVLMGRPEIPPNPITGAEKQPAIPSIGQQVADQTKVLAHLVPLVESMHHELHPNGGSSMKDSQGRLEGAVAELRTLMHIMERRLERGDVRFDDVTTRLQSIEAVLADELHTAQRVAETATDAVGHAAEASKDLLTTIHDAILADPPADIT